jgi:hypothetical protein
MAVVRRACGRLACAWHPIEPACDGHHMCGGREELGGLSIEYWYCADAAQVMSGLGDAMRRWNFWTWRCSVDANMSRSRGRSSARSWLAGVRLDRALARQAIVPYCQDREDERG